MNIGDQLTWAYRSLIIIALLWFRFAEQYVGTWGMWLVWALIVFLLFYLPARSKKSKMQNQKTEAELSG